MSLDSMTLEEYRERVDSSFERKCVSPAARLDQKYFDVRGNPAELLVKIATDVEGIIGELRLEKDVKEVYVFGTHAKGTFWEGSDIDIALLMHREEIVLNQLRDPLYNELNERIRKKYPAKQGDELIKGGTIYPVHLHIHAVKPHGTVYDLREKQWITFGKTEGDHHRYEWQVLGIRVD